MLPIMTNSQTKPSSFSHDLAAWILTAGGLLLVLMTHLLPAFLSGLLVYELVLLLTRVVHLGSITGYRARVVAVSFFAVIVVAVVTLSILGIVAFFRSDAGSLPVLLNKMADIVEDSRKLVPPSYVELLPPDTDGMRTSTVEWLKDHAASLKSIGQTAGRIMVQILIGMIIGAMISLRGAKAAQDYKPLAHSLAARVTRLRQAFHRIVFAQIRIAALNASFTALYLWLILPLMDVHLPFVKTLIAITFVVGLLPVVGNLVSNTIIVVVSLSHSLPVALGSLAFLIVIHKLEYFLNAKIVGSRIRAQAWEILIAMLFMEMLFGIPGVIAAPIYYAYVKDELSSRGLI